MYTKYYLDDQIKDHEMVELMACMRKKRNAYRVFLGKPEVNRLLIRPGHRWEGEIKLLNTQNSTV